MNYLGAILRGQWFVRDSRVVQLPAVMHLWLELLCFFLLLCLLSVVCCRVCFDWCEAPLGAICRLG